MSVDAKILKLTSGEEIVCAVSNNPDNSHIVVAHPMKIYARPKVTVDGGMSESLSLHRWIHFSDTENFEVPKSQILTITNASVGLNKFYDYCIQRMKKEDKELVYPTDEELDEIELEEEYDDFFDYSDTMH